MTQLETAAHPVQQLETAPPPILVSRKDIIRQGDWLGTPCLTPGPEGELREEYTLPGGSRMAHTFRGQFRVWQDDDRVVILTEGPTVLAHPEHRHYSFKPGDLREWRRQRVVDPRTLIERPAAD